MPRQREIVKFPCMTKEQLGFWAALRQRLRRETGVTPKVHCEKYTGINGSTVWRADGSVRIHISRMLDFEARVDTLLHEWAHVLARTEEHNRAWSDAHGKCYRIMERLIQEWS